MNKSKFLKGGNTNFKKGRSYQIQELTFAKRTVIGRYSHREDEPSLDGPSRFFVFSNGDEFYRIECRNCLNSLYEINEMQHVKK